MKTYIDIVVWEQEKTHTRYRASFDNDRVVESLRRGETITVTSGDGTGIEIPVRGRQVVVKPGDRAIVISGEISFSTLQVVQIRNTHKALLANGFERR